MIRFTTRLPVNLWYLIRLGVVLLLVLGLPEAAQVAASGLGPANATAVTASVVKVTDLATLNPPIPDPSGITYLPASNRLVIVDGQVEAKTNFAIVFQSTNIWEMTLNGAITNKANISKVNSMVMITNSAVGLAFNPDNGHYFVVQNDPGYVFDVNPGDDQVIFTFDDDWTSFDTRPAGNNDPEGIAYDPQNKHIFVADGNGQEVYEYTTGGVLIHQFDVGQYGVVNPESVEFNAENNTLFVMSGSSTGQVIVECAIDGTLVKTYDISSSGAVLPAGLAYAPASDGSGVMRFYIIDRGVDIATDPGEVDGKLIELALDMKVYLPLVVR